MYFRNPTSGGIGLKSVKFIVVQDWVMVDGEYQVEVVHNLGTSNLIVGVYKDNINTNMNSVDIVTNSKIKLYNDIPINCKVVIFGVD